MFSVMSPLLTVLTLLVLVVSSPAAAVDTASIVLSTTAQSPFPVAPNFASFSIEISQALVYFGNATNVNQPFINLLNVLRLASGARGPSVRIGGNSAEESVWWESSDPLPANQTYAITPVDIMAYAAAFELFDGYAVIDTSLWQAGSAAWASAHARGVGKYWGWGRVEGVEVGNEPEIFHDAGVRPHNWSFFDYAREFEAHASALAQSGMPVGLIQGAGESARAG